MPARALVGVLLLAVAVPGFSKASGDWQMFTDKALRVSFRYPKDWKPSPAYYDRTYFGGSDGAMQLQAEQADTLQQSCKGSAEHHLHPFGVNPTIRLMKVQGRKACLIWPSDEQGANADAEIIVEYPLPVVIDGDSYNELVVYADKNHILEIARTIRFVAPTSRRK
jgi:TolB protein